MDEAVNMADRQRGGFYGTAQKTVAFITNRQAMRWVTPDTGAIRRREFDPAAFVRGRGILYSLSKEGRGSAGPLVTALTVAVTEAAEELAKRSPGSRLPLRMVALLDEAANVCRWRELPHLYSHYGRAVRFSANGADFIETGLTPAAPEAVPSAATGMSDLPRQGDIPRVAGLTFVLTDARGNESGVAPSVQYALSARPRGGCVPG